MIVVEPPAGVVDDELELDELPIELEPDDAGGATDEALDEPGADDIAELDDIIELEELDELDEELEELELEEPPPSAEPCEQAETSTAIDRNDPATVAARVRRDIGFSFLRRRRCRLGGFPDERVVRSGAGAASQKAGPA